VVQRLEVWIWGWNINDAERALSGFKPDYYDLIYVKVNNFLNSVKQNKCLFATRINAKNASLNTLVNQILSFYVKRYKPSQIARDIPFSKGLRNSIVTLKHFSVFIPRR
jgi:hypothetical protein